MKKVNFSTFHGAYIYLSINTTVHQRTLIFYQQLTTTSGLEDLNELWVNVVKLEGVWKIAGVQKLSNFEADWAPNEPQNKTNLDCVYLSRQHG